MRSLITGAAGFIGSHICEHCVQMGHTVIALDDLSGGRIENLPGNIQAFEKGSVLDDVFINRIFEQYKPDYVYHLAAYAAEGLSHFVRKFNYLNNVIGSVNLINAAVNYGVKRFVFTSSVAVYGLNAHGADEHQTPTPIDPYGIAKWTVEQDLMAAGRMFDLPFTIFRPGNVYGPRQNLNDGYRNAVGIFMRQCLNLHPMTIYGDGEQQRQFTYIDDVALYIAQCITMPETQDHIYNLGADSLHTVNEVAMNVLDSIRHIPYDDSLAMRRGGWVIQLPERYEAHTVKVDHRKANSVFGIKWNQSLGGGIEQMAIWAKTQTLTEPKQFTAIEISKGLPEHWARMANEHR